MSGRTLLPDLIERKQVAVLYFSPKSVHDGGRFE
jgi:hypothetical protein